MDKKPYSIHVLKHTPGGWHEQGDTVFKLEKDSDVFTLLDEAWEKRKLPGQREGNNRIKYTINMDRVVGTKGEKQVCIVVEEPTYLDGTFRAVTAFPVSK